MMLANRMSAAPRAMRATRPSRASTVAPKAIFGFGKKNEEPEEELAPPAKRGVFGLFGKKEEEFEEDEPASRGFSLPFFSK